jgi:hypothetical protein
VMRDTFSGHIAALCPALRYAGTTRASWPHLCQRVAHLVHRLKRTRSRSLRAIVKLRNCLGLGARGAADRAPTGGVTLASFASNMPNRQSQSSAGRALATYPSGSAWTRRPERPRHRRIILLHTGACKTAVRATPRLTAAGISAFVTLALTSCSREAPELPPQALWYSVEIPP